ncbi:MAG: acyl-CoA dehydrogenase family protein [Flavobacteriaceae bacterium]
MDFSLTDEQEGFIRAAREFAETEIAPKAEAYNREERFPVEIYRRMGKAGLLGVTIPKEWGGAGLDNVTMMRTIEELGYHCLVLSAVIGLNSVMTGQQLYHFGTDAQKDKYLGPLIRGDILLSIASTEPQGGSDVASAETVAKRDGDSYVLNGRKKWISYGVSSDAVMVLAKTDEQDGKPRFTIFIVDKGTPGMTVTLLPKMLTRHVDEVCEVVFDDCRVPQSARLGNEGSGLAIMLSSLEGNRCAFGARCAGAIRACLDESVAYANSRVLRGAPIARHQMIQAKIADMATNMEAAKYMVYHLAWLKDTGVQRARMESAMVKLFATDALMKASADAVQIQGALGTLEDSAVCRIFRDAKAHQIMEGTSEIQTMLIAEQLLASGAKSS